MTLAETYAARYAEGDKSWGSLVGLFHAALTEGANRERARCVGVMDAAFDKEGDDISNMTSREIFNVLVEAIRMTDA